MSRHVVIIGNGVAGVTAARFIRKLSNDAITIVSGETEHFYARTALMYIYMGHLRYRDTKPYEDGFWSKNRISLIQDVVAQIDTDNRVLHFQSGSMVRYDVLLIASGSRPRMPECNGQDLPGVQGLYGMPDLDLLEANTRGIRRAVIVGGGLIGIELAEMLHSRGIGVSFLVRESSYMSHVLPREESEMVNEEIKDHDIDLRLETGLEEISPGSTGRVREVHTTEGETIPCDFVGLTIGVEPNIEFVRSSKVETRTGVLVNKYFETNLPGVYAAGDCAEFRENGIGHRRIEQLWYTARRHGKTVAQTICGMRTPYQRGIYFNSAKFFNLEYQTYGVMPAQIPPGVRTLFWRDPASRRSIRVNYDEHSGAVQGIHALGVRLRQEVCQRWIMERRTIQYVLRHMRDADFDPEFTHRLEYDLGGTYGGGDADGAEWMSSGSRSFLERLWRPFRSRPDRNAGATA